MTNLKADTVVNARNFKNICNCKYPEHNFDSEKYIDFEKFEAAQNCKFFITVIKHQ